MALIVKELQAFDSDPFWFHLQLKWRRDIAAKKKNCVTVQSGLELQHKYS